jgi:hypothetical protein
MVKSLFASGVAGVALLLLSACSSNSTPASPTSGTPTVSSVAVTNTVVSASVLQMKATASLSDGTTRDVTAASTWATSNVAVAVVSAGGQVTILSSGDVDVRATYQSVTGTMRLALAQKFALSGLVTEGPPTEGPLANVKLTITSGADAGAIVTSDAKGAFRFNTVTAGLMSLDATKDGYLLWRVTDLTIDRDRQLELELFPTPPINGAGATATARCGDGSWSWAPTRGEACTINGGVIYGVCPGPLCDGRFRGFTR